MSLSAGVSLYLDAGITVKLNSWRVQQRTSESTVCGPLFCTAQIAPAGNTEAHCFVKSNCLLRLIRGLRRGLFNQMHHRLLFCGIVGEEVRLCSWCASTERQQGTDDGLVVALCRIGRFRPRGVEPQRLMGSCVV